MGARASPRTAAVTALPLGRAGRGWLGWVLSEAPPHVRACLLAGGLHEWRDQEANPELVPPGLHNANLSTELSGGVLSLDGVHAKVRRDGYRR